MIFASTNFKFSGKERTTKIFVREMVPRLYYRLATSDIRGFEVAKHYPRELKNYQNSIYQSENHETKEFFTYVSFFFVKS